MAAAIAAPLLQQHIRGYELLNSRLLPKAELVLKEAADNHRRRGAVRKRVLRMAEWVFHFRERFLIISVFLKKHRKRAVVGERGTIKVIEFFFPKKDQRGEF